MTSIEDVAMKAGVSRSTVSRYINKSGYVSDKSGLNIQKAIDHLDYEPNRIARGLAGKKTKTLALILPDIANSFFSEIAKAVINEARNYDYTVYVGNTDDDSKKIKDYLNNIRNNYIDGIIFASSELSSEDNEVIKKSNLPIIFLDRTPLSNEEIVVTSENKLGAMMAIDHLVEIGSKRIAHLSGPTNLYTAMERKKGYLHSVNNREWFTPEFIIEDTFTIAGGERATRILLKRNLGIDAIFAGNDLMAIGAMNVLKKKNIQIGLDIAICGFDNIEISEYVHPELTTISQSFYKMGVQATKLLISMIEGKTVNNKITKLEVDLKIRTSTLRKRR